MQRRDFLAGTAALAGTALVRPVGAAEPVKPGGDSFDPEGVSMFRGNPSHTHYGTGTLRDKLEIKWRYRTEVFRSELRGKPYVWTGTGWSGQAVQVGDKVIVGSLDKKLYCFDADTGKRKWKHEARRMYKSSACYYDGHVYIGNVDNVLRCVNAETGKRVWRYGTRADMDSSPVVAGGKLYVGGEDLSIYCFDPKTGEKLWRHIVDENRP
ncbi:MAG: outer membrane protein assembly factor BamB, partial [Myxococcota bacterium]